MTMTGSSAFVVEIQALQKLLAEKEVEIERLKAHLGHAADALDPNNPETCYIVALIAELRKAAE